MIMTSYSRSSGFSLLEIMVVISIISVLGAVSLPMYQSYQERARATEIILVFDSLRSGFRADLEQGPYQRCDEIKDRASAIMQPAESNVMLSVGFQPNRVGGGFNPVLMVVARTPTEGPVGHRVAVAVHDQLLERGMVSSGFVNSVVVAFNASLSDNAAPDCIQHVT